MVIKASSSKEVNALVADLAAESPVRRDSAIARLTIIGGRAIERLLALAANAAASSAARVAAFRALEGIADPRSIATILGALNADEHSVAIAACGTARAFLASPRGVEILDRLTALALDSDRPVPVRRAAIHAMSDLESTTIKPLLTALARDPHPEIAAIASPRALKRLVGPAQLLKDAEAGTLGPDANGLRQALQSVSADVPVETLHRLVERIRIQEGAESGPRRTEWTAARAAAHLALAQRGSRLALYDLRETLESARHPLPVGFLAALTAIGDTSCLEPIVAAYRHATSGRQPEDDWWRRHLADAFQTIVGREKLTRRSTAIKRLEKRSKDILNELWAPLKL